MLYVANVTCWCTKRLNSSGSRRVHRPFMLYIRNYHLTLQCRLQRIIKGIKLQSVYSFTPPWENRRRAAQVAVIKEIAESSTDFYAVHCPGVSTKVLFYCLWSPPALANSHARTTGQPSVAWLARQSLILVIITNIIIHTARAGSAHHGRKTLACRWVNNAIHGRLIFLNFLEIWLLWMYNSFPNFWINGNALWRIALMGWDKDKGTTDL